MRRALQITVAEEGDKAIVSGGLRPDGKATVYANVKSRTNALSRAVAYSKLRERFIARQPAFENLEWEDVRAVPTGRSSQLLI